MPCNFLRFRLYQLHVAVTNPGSNTINIPSAEALSFWSYVSLLWKSIRTSLHQTWWREKTSTLETLTKQDLQCFYLALCICISDWKSLPCQIQKIVNQKWDTFSHERIKEHIKQKWWDEDPAGGEKNALNRPSKPEGEWSSHDFGSKHTHDAIEETEEKRCCCLEDNSIRKAQSNGNSVHQHEHRHGPESEPLCRIAKSLHHRLPISTIRLRDDEVNSCCQY